MDRSLMRSVDLAGLSWDLRPWVIPIGYETLAVVVELWG